MAEERKWNVTTPDGKTIPVFAFDEADAIAKAQQQVEIGKITLPPPRNPSGDDMSFGDYANDLGKSAASGLLEGTASLPGIGGDIEGLGRMGINAASRFITGNQEDLVSTDPSLPTSTETTDWARTNLKDMTGVDIHYDPKSTIGEYAKTATSFVPGAVVMGPGSIIKGAIGRNALKYGVTPGLISEGAGQLTEGTKYEPWARAAAALITPSGAGKATGIAAATYRRAVDSFRRTPQGPATIEKLRILDDVVERAKDNASVYTGVSKGDALSKEMLRLKRGPDWRKFNADEKEAVQRAMTKGHVEQFADLIAPQSRFGIIAALVTSFLPGYATHGLTAAAASSVPSIVKVANSIRRGSKTKDIRSSISAGKKPSLPALDVPGQSFARGSQRVSQSEHPIIERWGHKYAWSPDTQTYRLMTLDEAP